MNFLRGLLLDNLGLKGISLLLAFLLWLQVGSQQNFQRTISVPLEFYNLPADLEITGDYTKEVDVIIRAQRRVKSVGRMSAVIDFKDARPGTAIVPLTADRNITNGPSGVEVLGIIPARLRLELERIAEKTVRVEPEIQGKPAPGYQLAAVRSWPSEVTVTGPQSSVDKMTQARTLPIDVSGRSASFTSSATLDPQDPRLRVDLSTPVEVEIDIEEERREVSFARISIEVEPKKEGVRLLTRSLKLVGSVPISFEGKLTAKDFKARVLVDELEPRDEPYELVPEIIPPQTGLLRLESLQPEKVKVRVR